MYQLIKQYKKKMNKGFRHEGIFNLKKILAKQNKVNEVVEQIFLQQLQNKLKGVLEQLQQQKRQYQQIMQNYFLKQKQQYTLKLNQKDRIIEELQKTIVNIKNNYQQNEDSLMKKLQYKEEEIISLRNILKKKYLTEIALERKVKQLEKTNLEFFNSTLSKIQKVNTTKTREISPRSTQIQEITTFKVQNAGVPLQKNFSPIKQKNIAIVPEEKSKRNHVLHYFQMKKRQKQQKAYLIKFSSEPKIIFS